MTPDERVCAAGAKALRETVQLGPFGPNTLEILNRGGRTWLTGSEAQMGAQAVLAVAGRQVSTERVRQVATAHEVDWRHVEALAVSLGLTVTG